MKKGSLMRRRKRKKLPNVFYYKVSLWAYRAWDPLEKSVQRRVILRMVTQLKSQVVPVSEWTTGKFSMHQLRQALRKGLMKRLVAAGIGLPGWRACLKREVFNDT